MKKKVLLTALLFFSACGSDFTETYLSKFIDSIYMEKRATPFYSRMSPILTREVRQKWLEIYGAKEKLSAQYVSHFLTGVKSKKIGSRKFLHGYIQQYSRMGRTSYRTFLAKYYLKEVSGTTKRTWILYDLIIKRRKKRSAAMELIRLTEPSSAAKEVLQSLKKEINIFVFGRLRNTLTTHLLKEFAVHSKGKIKLKYLNLYIEWGTAAAFDISAPGYVVVQCGRNNYKIKISQLIFQRGTKAFFQGERVLMTAIRRVCGRSSRILYLTGHGERSAAEGRDTHFSKAMVELGRSGFTVQSARYLTPQNLKRNPIVFSVAPLYNFTPGELKLLSHHHQQGGKSVLMLEKPVPATLRQLVSKWGIQLLRHTIVDLTTKDFIRGPFCFESRIPDTPLTRSHTARENFKVIVAGATGMRINTNIQSPAVPNSFLITTTNGWAEARYERDKSDDIMFTPDEDIRGPIALGYAIRKVQQKGKVLLYGDSDFISDSFFLSKISNWVFFLNSLTWLTDSAMGSLPIRSFLYSKLQGFL